MARIAFAWELGTDFGHALGCDTLAKILRSRGHRIAYMFRELYQLGFLGEHAAHEVFQAPVSVSEGRGQGIPASFADILVGCGYDRAEHVSGLLGAWLALFHHWKPDLVLCDFSPTALLAARMLGIRRVSWGNGFAVPPRLTPLPAFRVDAPIDSQRVIDADARALASTNGALAHHGRAPLASLAQQFETDEDFLATFPELDSYGTRPSAGYWGPRYSVDQGERIPWPEGQGKRVLVYVKKTLGALDGLIGALTATNVRLIAFIPELDAARVAILRSPRRNVSMQPVRLGPLLADCDLMVSQGGNLTVGSLTRGVPQLVFPTQYEQYLTARRIEQTGTGAWLPPDAKPDAVSATLSRLLGDPAFGATAKAYAQRYPDYSPQEQLRRITARLEQILAKPSRWSALPATSTPSILAPTPNPPNPLR